MHGFYQERTNLRELGYYDFMDAHGLFPRGNRNENHWRTYAATVIDFDRAIGVMLTDLEEKNLLDDTTIVIMSDHNSYYDGLTAYAKGLDSIFDPEGYRVPFIIYDKKLARAMDERGESRTLEKFITSVDLVPTVFDILGIPAWKNMYPGISIFCDEESIGLSRAYKLFFSENIVCYNINDLKFKSPFFSDDFIGNKNYLGTVEDYIGSLDDPKSDTFIYRAYKHLDKLFYLDKIYLGDYFKGREFREAGK
jgi:hypothetical protein